jgi:hypothetical protein
MIKYIKTVAPDDNVEEAKGGVDFEITNGY